ncbi:hypothetical protein ACFE04_021770 [Oxalis oulophora]
MSEENLFPLLQRYSTLIVLRMLGQIVDNLGEKLDWNELARNTSTEITHPRKYQMLWRHLAYGDLLVDVGDVEQPLFKNCVINLRDLFSYLAIEFKIRGYSESALMARETESANNFNLTIGE